MPYLLGANVSDNKPIYTGLTEIYGIGLKNAKEVCFNLGINKKVLVKNLTNTQISKIQKYISNNFVTHGSLKKENQLQIQRLIENKSYRGRRHSLHLPVRGQRTRTNAKTAQRRQK